MRQLLLIICLMTVVGFADEAAPRARDLGIPFDGTPGPLNAITDVAGAPVGREIPVTQIADIRSPMDDEMGPIIVVIATDATLLPHQLKRVATRAGLGVARVGGMASNGSGDIFIAFSTANPRELRAGTNLSVSMLGNEHVTPVFSGAVLATEEAIVNALVAARTMTGFEGRTIEAIDHEALRSALRKYNRLQGSE